MAFCVYTEWSLCFLADWRFCWRAESFSIGEVRISFTDLTSPSRVFSRILVGMDPLSNFLKKKARAHKYRSKLTANEIHQIVLRHVPRLRSIQVLNFGPKTEWPEVTDEYHEEADRIVQDLRTDLQSEFRKKIKCPPGTTVEQGINDYLRSL